MENRHVKSMEVLCFFRAFICEKYVKTWKMGL